MHGAARGGTVTSEGIGTTIVRDQKAFDGLAAEWNQLYEGCASATPFQSHAWLASWAREYCPPGRLRVVLVRSGGRLVAAAPLRVTRRAGLPVLATLGGELSDYGDLLVDPDDELVADALVAALLAESGWSALDLPHLRPEAAARSWARRWPGNVTRLPDSSSLELPGEPMTEVLARLPGRSAKVVRKKLRNVDDLALRVDDVPAQAVPDGIGRMLHLHQEQWRGRGMTPEHGTARFARHLTEAMRAMVASGQARITEYHLDGELLASQLYLIGPLFVGAYLAGISPRLRERADVSALMVREDLRITSDLGVPRYSMMRGLEEYKLRWRPDVVVNERLVLARPRSVRGAAVARLALARRGAVTLVNRRAPWVVQLRSRLRRS
jgi:CelD/BcsL family acetyltransferase involved in cellulose biosynthesis